jgi:hypothetical protein
MWVIPSTPILGILKQSCIWWGWQHWMLSLFYLLLYITPWPQVSQPITLVATGGGYYQHLCKQWLGYFRGIKGSMLEGTLVGVVKEVDPWDFFLWSQHRSHRWAFPCPFQTNFLMHIMLTP